MNPKGITVRFTTTLVLALTVGYEYWHNKYGNQPGVGTQVNAPQFQLEWHF